MTEKDKEISLEELCKAFQDRVPVRKEEKPVTDGASDTMAAGEHGSRRSKLQITCHLSAKEFSCKDSSSRTKKQQNSSAQKAKQSEERIPLRIPKVTKKTCSKPPSNSHTF